MYIYIYLVFHLVFFSIKGHLFGLTSLFDWEKQPRLFRNKSTAAHRRQAGTGRSKGGCARAEGAEVQEHTHDHFECLNVHIDMHII